MAEPRLTAPRTTPRGSSAGKRARRGPYSGAEVDSLLLIEDSPSDAALIREWLADSGLTYRVTHCTRLADALHLVRQSHPFGAVLLDLSLPDAEGVEGVRALRDVDGLVPLVVLTGVSDGERLASACVAAGAHDYLEKDAVTPRGLRRSLDLALARASAGSAQARLVHAERLQALGRLAAGVVHEINNPLQFVMTNLGVVAEAMSRAQARLGLESPELAEELRESEAAVEEARRGTERVAKIVAGLREFASFQEDEPRLLDLRDVVDQARAMTRSHVVRCARLEVDVGELVVLGQEVRLTQVLVNLIVNAADAISASGARRGLIRVRGAAGADTVELHVSDDGCGMSERDLARVFEPFVSSKEDGLGLGLALSRDIAEEHGGALEASSALGEGTTFVLRLPRATERASASEVVEPGDALVLPSLRLLVVDDEPLVLRAIGRALYAHDLTLCESGDAALSAVQSAPAPYDAVICDLSMPGMSGRELYEQLAWVDPELAKRFLVLTGGALGKEDAEFAIRLGALTKPVSAEALEQRLARFGARRG